MSPSFVAKRLRAWSPRALPLRAFAVGIATTVFVNDKIMEWTVVNGPSMAPTLSPHFEATGQRDHVLWSKWNDGRDLKRGDIVKFATPHDPEHDAVKRVVALAGDTVVLDPERRPRESNADRVSARAWDSWPRRRVTVPYGHVWVEGDNWRNTADSNTYGPISQSLINARAVCIIYPWSRFGLTPWEEWKNVKEIRKTRVIEGAPKLPVEYDDSIVSHGFG